MPKNGISGTNNNTTLNIRNENMKFLIITNSVLIDKKEIYTNLNNKGESIHYLIDKKGVQTQFSSENEKTFINGVSLFRGNLSLNKSSVHVMLVNSGNETYTKEQKDKLKDFLKDFRDRNPEIDLKVNFLGLSEVAIIEKQELREGEGRIFPRVQAPGKIFWTELAEELAEQGFGLFVPTTLEEKAEVWISPASSSLEILDLQSKLWDYGFGIEITGKYDEATKAWVTCFNHRYVPSVTQAIDLSIWSKASQLSLNHIRDYMNAKTNTLAQSFNSTNGFFTVSASATNVDNVDMHVVAKFIN